MCRPTTCKSCGGTTWAGCGQHVDQVMANVPESRRCDCERGQRGGAERSSSGGRSLVDRILGR